MPMIYCSLDMFAYNQAVRIIEYDTNVVIYTNIDDIADTIAQLCKERDITNIHLYGNEEFLKHTITDIQISYNLHYHCGKPLNIEVN